MSLKGNNSDALISESIRTAEKSLAIFRNNWSARYGQSGPKFMTLQMKDTIKNIKEKKLNLAVYLHRASEQTDSFCRKILCNPEVLSLLRNYHVWGWDMTLPLNEGIFKGLCKKFLPKYDTILAMENASYPLLVLIDHNLSSDNVEVIRGQENVDTIIKHLQSYEASKPEEANSDGGKGENIVDNDITKEH